MATFTSVLLTVTILVSACSSAPNKQKQGLTIPDECKGKGFCAIKPEGYDEMQELISTLLTPKIIAQNMGDRMGDTKLEELSPETDWHNCPYRKKTEQSLFAYSYSNDTDPDYIIQHTLLRQPVDIVTCAHDKIDINSSEQCFQHMGLGDFHMKSSCRTSTARRSLLVLDYKTKQLKKKSYDVPCCCTCQIIRSDNDELIRLD